MNKGADMLHVLRRATWIALLLPLASQGQALAATAEVSITNFSFNPGAVNLRLGDSVHWTNNDEVPHTSTGDSPLALWNSGNIPSGQDFTFAFSAAGTYPYHCNIHTFMAAQLTVKPKATPDGAPAGTGFKIKVATAPAGADFVFDVQKKDPGGQFRNWMVGITTNVANFDSTGKAPGIYQFRSRLRRVSNGGTSGFSPQVSIQITQ